MSYRKFLLKTNWYSFTITDSYLNENDRLILCFTVDSGEEAYRHVVQEYVIDIRNVERLIRLFKDADYVLIEDTYNLFFVEQFIGLRVEGKVDRVVLGQVVKNVIIELRAATKKPSYNVMKEKSDEHYYKEKKGRQLAIDEGEGLSEYNSTEGIRELQEKYKA